MVVAAFQSRWSAARKVYLKPDPADGDVAMKETNVARAWRDGEFFASLSEEERAQMPANPAALPSVDDDVLNSVTGGCCPPGWSSAICSPCPPAHCF